MIGAPSRPGRCRIHASAHLRIRYATRFPATSLTVAVHHREVVVAEVHLVGVVVGRGAWLVSLVFLAVSLGRGGSRRSQRAPGEWSADPLRSWHRGFTSRSSSR